MFQCLLDLDTNNLLETAIDLAPAVYAQSSVLLRDIVPQEGEIEHHSSNERKGRDDPDDEGEKHGEKDHSLLMISIPKRADIDEKLFSISATAASGIGARRHEISLKERVQSHAVDDLTGSFCQNDS